MAVIERKLGKKEQISISDAEASYGSVATLVLPLGRNATFEPNKNTPNITEILGPAADTLDVGAREFGQEDFGGVLNFVPQDWRFLKFALLSISSDVTDTNSGGYYTHTFTNSTTGLLSFTLERAIQGTVDHVRTYEGCQIDNLSFSWDASSPGNFLQASADILAEDANNSTSMTDLLSSIPATEGFKPRHVLLTLGAAAVAYLKSGTFTIQNTLSDGRYAHSTLAKLKGESSPQLRRYKLTAVAEYTDDTFFDYLDGGVVLAGTNKLVFNRGTNDELAITFTGAYLNKASDPTNLDGVNQVTLEIEINNAAFVAKDALTDYETFT